MDDRIAAHGRIRQLTVVAENAAGERVETGEVDYLFWCPGCERAHRYAVNAPAGPSWTLTGWPDAPTFNPSLLVDPNGKRCHLYLENGRLRFLGDCHHGLAGRTVDVPELPSWLRN